MNCTRCKQESADEDLKPPSKVLRIFAFPYLLLMQSGSALKESNAGYCRPCRRQMNVCLLFLGFLVLMFVLMLFMADKT